MYNGILQIDIFELGKIETERKIINFENINLKPCTRDIRTRVYNNLHKT